MFRWHQYRLNQSARFNIPTEPGVYVLIENQIVNGLPLNNRALYVGKTENLRRRFNDYSNPQKVHNELVGERIMNNQVEFWYTKVSSHDLDRVERLFIHDFNTPMNKIKYKEYNRDRSD
ncbi:GIY-YIG nuclease family protein [Vibrio lamellibrachiae]|uniref:GIY-YIG nuclease family protein n=1 Tax=Vibrio lamellibrachiae TaxID=2910253 RepID=UPI003D12FB93